MALCHSGRNPRNFFWSDLIGSDQNDRNRSESDLKNWPYLCHSDWKKFQADSERIRSDPVGYGKDLALGDYVRAIRLFGPTDGFSTQVVRNFFPYSMYLSYSHFLVNRVNSLTKLSSACTDQQTSAMPSTKLLSVIEGLNVPVWPLIGSALIAIPWLSRKQAAGRWLGAEILYLSI